MPAGVVETLLAGNVWVKEVLLIGSLPHAVAVPHCTPSIQHIVPSSPTGISRYPVFTKKKMQVSVLPAVGHFYSDDEQNVLTAHLLVSKRAASWHVGFGLM